MLVLGMQTRQRIGNCGKMPVSNKPTEKIILVGLDCLFQFMIFYFYCYCFTVPLMVKTTCFAFELTVIDLWKGPSLLVSYLTLIAPASPGSMGFFGQEGVVQPQDALTFVSTREIGRASCRERV